MSLLAFLADGVEDASRDLPAVERRRMFGCDAWFAAGAIFALVWKHGRIGLKLPDPEAYAELFALPGAAPWTAGTKTMSGWVLVPEAFHDDPAALRAWVARAHRAALAAPAKRPAARKTAAGKKPANKRPVARTSTPRSR
jgi:DNA transformation protein